MTMSKQILMTNNRSGHFDLEERTFHYAQNVIKLTKEATKTIQNVEVIKQLVRSAGSVGANYIEANEALGKKISCTGFVFREKKLKNPGTG